MTLTQVLVLPGSFVCALALFTLFVFLARHTHTLPLFYLPCHLIPVMPFALLRLRLPVVFTDSLHRWCISQCAVDGAVAHNCGQSIWGEQVPALSARHFLHRRSVRQRGTLVWNARVSGWVGGLWRGIASLSI